MVLFLIRLVVSDFPCLVGYSGGTCILFDMVDALREIILSGSPFRPNLLQFLF